MEIIPFLLFLAFLFVAIGLFIAFIMRGVQIIPEGTVGIVERQGRFLNVIDPGRHLLMPFDRIRVLVPMQEFDELVHAERVVMRNAITIGIDMYVQYRIAHYQPQMVAPEQARRMQAEPVIQSSRGRVRQRDVYNATYGVDDWHEKTRKEALAVLQDCLAMVDLAKDIFGSQANGLKQLSALVKRKVNERTLLYGVEVTDINLTNPVIDDSTRDFLTSIRKAELQNRVRQLEAESQAKIQQLEAENQAKIQRVLNLSREELLRWRYIETLKEISQNNPAARIYVSGDGGDEVGRSEEGDKAADFEGAIPADQAQNRQPARPNLRAPQAYPSNGQPVMNDAQV